MSKKKPGKKETAHAKPPELIRNVILERLRRLNSLPLHRLDWRTEYMLNHFLGGRKRI